MPEYGASIEVGVSWSDRTVGLLDGSVLASNSKLRFSTAPPGELFLRLLGGDLDVSEFSFGTFVIERSRGNNEFFGLPIFPSRMFRHSAIYVRAGGDVREPSDLVGKVVGVPEYQMTAAIWVRAFLHSEYGILANDVSWKTGGVNRAGRRERIPLRLSRPVDVTPIGDTKTLNEALLSGEIDALVSPIVPEAFENSVECRIVRLLPEYGKLERKYFKRTSVFPIMHIVAGRRALLQKHPDLREELISAFTASKNAAISRLEDTDFLCTSLAWLPTVVEEHRQLLGADLWPYGVDASRTTIESFLDACRDQGLLGSDVSIDDLFT